MQADWPTVVVGVLTVFLMWREQASKKRSDDLKIQLSEVQKDFKIEMLQMEARIAEKLTNVLIMNNREIETKLEQLWSALNSQRRELEARIEKHIPGRSQ